MTITITNDDLHTTNEQLAARVADLEREADILAGECRDAQATAEQFACERDDAERELAAEHTRADGLHAANVALVADHLRRQEQLQAEARMYERVSYELQDALDDKHLELRRVCEQFADLTTAYGQVETELRGAEQEISRLANQPKPWWWRRVGGQT